MNTILLVEDDHLFAKTKKAVLENAGYRAALVGSGTEAVSRCLEDATIDLVLLDIDLGYGMDGTEAAEVILKDREIPVVFLSAHATPEMAARAERISSYGYVLKDSGDAVLLASIRMAFRLHAAHRKIREDSDRYRSLFETVTQGIVHQAADGAIISANPAAEDILGLTFDQMRGKTSMDPQWCMIREDGSSVTAEDHPAMIALRTGETVGPVIRGVRHARRQGNVWLRIIAVPLFEPHGTVPYQAYATFEDITSERDAHDWHRTLVNHLPGVVYAFSNKRGSLYWSNQAADILGYDPGEIKANPFIWNDSIHPEDIPAVRHAMESYSQGTDYSVEYRFRTKAGSWIWLHDRFIRKTVHDDEIVVDGFTADITERKQAEETLRSNEKKLKAILDNLPDLLFRYDTDGNYRECFASNRALLYDPDLLGKNIHDVLPAPIAGQFAHCLEEARRTGETQKLEYSLDVPVGLRHFEARMVPVDDESTLGIIRNVTEQHHDREEIQRLLAEKETLMKEVQHRIKNNMNTMMSLLSLQAGSLHDRNAIDALNDAAGRFHSLQVLYDQLYRTESHSQGSLAEYMKQLVERVIRVFPDGDAVRVSVDVEECTHSARVLTTVGLIINELLTNAMKYAFRDHGDPHLVVTGRRHGEHCFITVADNGPGMPESFDAGPDGAGADAGFGMTVVHALTDQLGGTIAFERDGGTTVSLRFPIDTEHLSDSTGR